jgi:hypothetical protein
MRHSRTLPLRIILERAHFREKRVLKGQRLPLSTAIPLIAILSLGLWVGIGWLVAALFF